MPPSLSRSQIDRLGDHLRRSATPDADDLRLLADLRREYDGPMVRVQHLLEERLGIESSSRLKTVNTIVEKLRREKTRLSTMQDVAGLRAVRDMTLNEQDSLVEQILGLFPDGQIVDRRQTPTHGYRAVHVIMKDDGFPVEFQVRTSLQDLWAQAFEKLADVLGREIRYGHLPSAQEPGGPQAREVIEGLQVLSVAIAKVEDVRSGRLSLPAANVDEAERLLRSGLEKVLQILERMAPEST